MAERAVNSNSLDRNSVCQQMVQMIMGRGVDCNCLVVGDSGLGKSTLIDTLFYCDVATRAQTDSNGGRHDCGGGDEGCDVDGDVEVRLIEHRVTHSAPLRLTVYETCHFGDQMQARPAIQALVDFVDSRFHDHLERELMVDPKLYRPRPHPMVTRSDAVDEMTDSRASDGDQGDDTDGAATRDGRIHFCIYLISPTGRSLRALDLVTLKELSQRINVVPVIAKSDLLTAAELNAFKARVNAELRAHHVRVFAFDDVPDEQANGDHVTTTTNGVSNGSSNGHTAGGQSGGGHEPFAVVGSVDTTKVGTRQVRARQYPWGTVHVDNQAHCDTLLLRRKLVHTHLYRLVTSTDRLLYEHFRHDYLKAAGIVDVEECANRNGSSSGGGPYTLLDAYANERTRQLLELKTAEEKMKEKFFQRINDAESKLQTREKELKGQFDSIQEQYKARKLEIKKEIEVVEQERKRTEDMCNQAKGLLKK